MVRESLIKKALISITLLALFIGATIPVTSAALPTETIQAGGSSFQAPLDQAWGPVFQFVTGGAVSVNYASTSSGTGQTDLFKALTYSYAGSDVPIMSAKYQENATYASNGPAISFADTLGGVAVFYNLPGLSASHPLNLTGNIIGRIYTQQIILWNSSAILSINPYYTAAQLAYPIYPVHRTAGSGTTDILTTFLARSGSYWNSTAEGGLDEVGTSPSWPTGGNNLTHSITESAQSSSGNVASAVNGQTGGIGYADTVYALGHSSTVAAAAIENSAGKFVLPSLATIAAAANADAALTAANSVYQISWAPTPGGSAVQSYPISGYTYIITWQFWTGASGTQSTGVGQDLANFFMWAVTSGQADASHLYYAPLPAAVVAADEAVITSMESCTSITGFSVSDCAGATPFLTSNTATVTCTPSTILVGLHTTCTVSVAGGVKGAAVSFSSSETGTFSATACLLSGSHTCHVAFTATSAGSSTIQATYVNSAQGTTFLGSTSITATQKTSKVTLACKPGTIAAVSATTICTAVVKGYGPTGSVTFSSTGGTGTASGYASCALAPVGHSTTSSECHVTLTGTKAGTVDLSAAYGGDVNNTPASASKILTVK